MVIGRENKIDKGNPYILIKLNNLSIGYNVTSLILVYYGNIKVILNEEEMYDQDHRTYMW